MTITKGMKQAYDMQDLAYNAAMALGEQLKQDGRVLPPDKEQAAMIAALNKAWRDAQEQIRIHRGKPLPGSLTYEKVGGRAKRIARSSASVMLASESATSDPEVATCLHGVQVGLHCAQCLQASEPPTT